MNNDQFQAHLRTGLTTGATALAMLGMSSSHVELLSGLALWIGTLIWSHWHHATDKDAASGFTGSLKVLALFIPAALACAFLSAGCMTTKTPVVTPTTNSVGAVSYSTNFVTTVNQAGLTADCAVLQATVGLATSLTVQADPSATNALVDIETALTGIINGASTNSVAQIATLLKSSSNQAVLNNLAPLVNTISGLEQSLKTKYGAVVGVQIGVAIATAVNNGIASGLPKLAPKS